ncbi:uncharacterized protein [Henckelia pumila]|uniref:uncharacterized protein n=1 Tax=Henckelia pumila TaxID=405737 RepID=UPI003C6E932B
MSHISCLVLVLLCSFHACNARSLGVVNKEPTQDHFHSKRQENNAGKLNDTGVLSQHDKQYSSLPKVSEGAKKEYKSKDVIMVNSANSKDGGNKDDPKAKGDQIHVPDSGKNESLASVSWKVPNKKREDPEPGFNLDYLPPKTHPPIHN